MEIYCSAKLPNCLHQRSQQTGDGIRSVPDADEAHVIALARVVRGYLGFEQVEV